VAEETLAIAVYSALRRPDDFEAAIIAAVNHNGDSDSTGSACGNIMDAYLGYEAIPGKFKSHLESLDVILEVADDLWHDLLSPIDRKKYKALLDYLGERYWNELT
jgi:ADP-ribosylglycohydrolase